MNGLGVVLALVGVFAPAATAAVLAVREHERVRRLNAARRELLRRRLLAAGVTAANESRWAS